MFGKMLFLCFTNLSQGNFFDCLRFFILTKNLNTVHTPSPTEMKQNLLHLFFGTIALLYPPFFVDDSGAEFHAD